MTWQDQTDNVMKICRDTFSTSCTYQPKTGPSYSITGIFDDAFQEVQTLDGALIQSTTPRLGVRKLDLLATPVSGDKVIINSKTYKVVEYRPDGEAGAVLILHNVTGS